MPLRAALVTAPWWDTGECPDCGRVIWWQTDDGLVTYFCRGCDWQRTAAADRPLADQFGGDQ